MNRRVVITGLGIISALGKGVADFWAALSNGRSGIRPIEAVDSSQYRFQNGAQVPNYNAAQFFEEKDIAFLDRFAQFAVIAARAAVADSGVQFTKHLKERSAIVTGSCAAGKITEDEGYWQLYHERNTRVNPMSIARSMANAGASRISLEFGITGPVYTISTACSSSNHALGQAFWMVRQGSAELALTGGSEALFCTGMLKAWEAMRVVSPDTCRPFSLDRRGLILGEGGAMLVMEPLEAAQARGARIYGEIVGFGMSSDAHHITQPSAAGGESAMRCAIADAGCVPEQIGYINAHGTGTPTNDATETAAIRAVFGDHADVLAVSSTKSMHGHALGAAGAIEAVATVLAIGRGVLPPTANYTEPDPACNLDVIPNVPRTQQVEYALSNSFAFGGLNAVLAFKRWP